MKKKVIIVVVIIVLMILLVPIPFKLRDGGTVEWKSLTYSIANVHSIYAVGNESNKYELGYKEGIVIKIFNMTVYNNTKYSLKEEFAIIDNSKEFDCNNIEEEIYRDDEYIYYLPCEKSQYIKVIYAPNEYQEGLKSSLAEGNIKISDLDKFNICIAMFSRFKLDTPYSLAFCLDWLDLAIMLAQDSQQFLMCGKRLVSGWI